MPSPIASILHRDTIAALVGAKTFERGQQCFASGRVLSVEPGAGQLRGTVKPSEAGRATYTVRIWTKDDGMAYACNCPIGLQNAFCKHGVAIALAHMQEERRRAEDQLQTLRRAMRAIPVGTLVDALVDAAGEDFRLKTLLAEVCVRLLGR